MVSKRINHIDIAKGIGVLLVVLGHCLAYGCQNQIFRCIYSFHMPLFFFLSGYVFHAKDSKSFFEGKIKFLLLPMIFFQAFNVTSYSGLWVIGKIVGYEFTKYHSLISFGGFWFVTTLLYVACLYFVVNEKIACSLGTKNVPMFCFAVLFLGLGLIYAPHISNTPNQPIATTMTAFFFYTVGNLFNQLFDNMSQEEIRNKRFWAFVFGVVLLGLCFYLNGFSNKNVDFNTSRYGNRFLFVVNALIGSFAIFFISYGIHKSKILEWYGRNSLMILFIHIPLWKCFDRLIIHATSMRGGEKSITVFTIALLISTIVVLFINRFFPWLTGKIEFSDRR